MKCTACDHVHQGAQFAFICIGCPCPETPGADEPTPPEDWKIILGLKHGPQSSDWDPELQVWAPAMFGVEEGVLGGWRWCTDTYTALLEPAPGVPDTSMWSGGVSDRERYMAARVYELVHPDDGPPTVYLVEAEAMAVLGGIGELVPFGFYDLERVNQAAWWASGPNDNQLWIGVTASKAGAPRLHMQSTEGRYALVMSTVMNEGCWCPTIADLPLEGPLKGGWR